MIRLFSLRTLIVAISLMGIHLTAGTPDRPFRWADDENFKPMIYRDASGNPAGIFKDILGELFRRLNLPMECRLYPWSRAQKLVLEGQADGMVTVLTEERKRLLKATEPLVTMEERVFTSRRNPKFRQILAVKSLDDLRKFTLVETTGSGWSKEQFKGMNVIWVPTSDSALNMIATGRADIFLMGNFTGPQFLREQIRKNGPLTDSLKEIVMGPATLAEVKYRLLIRKDSPYADMIEDLDRTLQEMKKDGSYQEILKRYGTHKRNNEVESENAESPVHIPFDRHRNR